MSDYIEVRKLINAPLIKKEVEEICAERGISPTEYAYELIREDVLLRIERKKCTSPNPLLDRIKEIVSKFTK